MRALKALYRPLLRGSLRLRWLVLAGAVAMVLAAAALATRLGSEFVPRLLEGALVINTVRLSGVAVEESVRYGSQIEKALLAKFPDEVERVWTRTGTAEVATDPMGLELSDVFVTLRPRDRWRKARTQTELVSRMSQELDGLPGMRMIFTQPIEMRVNEMVAGIRSDVGIKVFGDDLDILKRKAREIESVLKLVPGAADVSTETMTGQSLLSIEVDRVAASRFGIPAQEILRTVEALGTRVVGQLQEGERRFPITLRIHDRYRLDAASLGRILVSSPRGERVPLARVTRMSVTEGPSTVSREWARRRVIVQANVRDRDIGSFVTEVKKALAENVELPAGYYLRYGGQFEHLEKARDRLLIVVPLALALILALLLVTYGRWLDALRVFSGVPLAVVGGVAALWLRDLPFSISAAVGFVALSGVSVLGDMVLVSTIRANLDRGLPLREALLDACEERLRPVLMTALVASLGFVPMALNTGLGAEVQRPLATVVIGGVISSTLLTLLVLPVLYTLVPPAPSTDGEAPRDRRPAGARSSG